MVRNETGFWKGCEMKRVSAILLALCIALAAPRPGRPEGAGKSESAERFEASGKPESAGKRETSGRLEASANSIRPAAVYDYCKTISSERFAGRLTGDEGYSEAARWAAAMFRAWGLRPPGSKDGCLQPYPSPYTLVDEAEMTFLVPPRGDTLGAAPSEVKLEPGKDFLPTLYTDSGDRTGGLVFVGWGICAPELSYDDYAGVDVAGKYVLCFRGTPDEKNKAYQEHDQHRHRMRTARDHGALGLIYIYPEVNAHPNSDWIEGFTAAMISTKAADTLFAELALTAAEVERELEAKKTPHSFALRASVRYRVSSRHFPNGVGYNIVGLIQGSDPRLRDQCIVVGGHFDHCGRHMGMLFAGADDNASGSATVMAIAEAFAKYGTRPKRSVLFVLFGGEEQGLIGSSYFAEHLPAPFTKVDAMFNFDMTGEGDGTNYGCTPEPPELKRTIEIANKGVGTIRRDWPIKEVGVRSSDYAPFFQKGAACAAFFSNGPHVAYHQTGDTIYRINPDMLADVARLGFLSAYRWADR